MNSDPLELVGRAVWAAEVPGKVIPATGGAYGICAGHTGNEDDVHSTSSLLAPTQPLSRPGKRPHLRAQESALSTAWLRFPNSLWLNIHALPGVSTSTGIWKGGEMGIGCGRVPGLNKSGPSQHKLPR